MRFKLLWNMQWTLIVVARFPYDKMRIVKQERALNGDAGYKTESGFVCKLLFLFVNCRVLLRWEYRNG